MIPVGSFYMYYTAAAGETGAIYDPLADESATSRPPPPPQGGMAIISFAWFFVLKWISGIDPTKKKGKSTAQLESLNKNPSYYNMLQGLYLYTDWATLLSYLLDTYE